MKVKPVEVDDLAFEDGKIYEVISIEDGWYRVMTEIGEDYVFPPSYFEIIDNTGKEELEANDPFGDNDLVEIECRGMKVKCTCDTLSGYMMKGKVYEVLATKGSWYRIVDETGEDTLYPASGFEIVEE